LQNFSWAHHSLSFNWGTWFQTNAIPSGYNHFS
jgi:hypothetical protein